MLSNGLKFVPTPKSPDLMILEKDIKNFVRLLKLKEYFHNSNQNVDDSILKPPSDFTPTQVKNPVLLSVCDSLTNMAENLENLVPKNFHYNNLKPDERLALKNLKKDESIIIKEADKGSMVVILDKTFYQKQISMTLSNTEIYEKQKKNTDNSNFNKIKKLAKKYYSSGVLTAKEKRYISCFNFSTANFYGNPKIHKSQTIKNAIKNCENSYVHIQTEDVKFRGISGGPNSPTSKLSELLSLLLKPFVSQVKSHIRDTTDFLNKFKRFSKTELNDIVLVTVDVVNMYPSIKKDLGFKALKYFCKKYPYLLHERFNIDFIIESMTIILDYNLVQFDDCYYTQISGTTTGTTVAPIYATLTMAYLETILMDKLKNTYNSGVIEYIHENWLRFLDDCFLPWNKKFGNIQIFIDILNSLDNNINFTFEMNEQKISFLNVTVYKGENNLMCDIFYKETDTKEYLPFNSCHVRHCKINVPYNLCRTVCTIVEDKNILNDRLDEVKTSLLKAKYPVKVINSAITRAKNVPQAELRTPSEKDDENVLTFVSDYNPKNPNILHYLYNCMSLLRANPTLKLIFDGVKFINSKREPPSLRSMLTHSKFSSKPTPGVKKCNHKKCKNCTNMYETDQYNFWRVGIIWNIYDSIDCSTKDCIYVLTCKGCAHYYIGKTVNLRNRMTKHRGDITYIDRCITKVHRHIDECGKGEFFVTPFYKVKTQGLTAHLSIESYFIRKFQPLLNTMGMA